jgi:hypothetical protein
VSNIRSLQQALKEVLADDNKISKYEARVLRELILADGKISNDERRLLREALEKDQFDPEAFNLLSETLLRADVGRR